MKSLLFGVLLIIILGIGGLVYRNAVEHPSQQIACPLDAKICPDGTSVSRTGLSCTFAPCQLPNISLSNIGISFAIPDGFSDAVLPDTATVVAYEMPQDSLTGESSASIVIRSYTIDDSETALSTIKNTAIGGASGQPVGATSFSSTVFGSHRFTVVSIERFEGVVDTAYYLARSTDVLRFDAIDRGADWTNPNLDVTALPAHRAAAQLLTNLQGQ